MAPVTLACSAARQPINIGSPGLWGGRPRPHWGIIAQVRAIAREAREPIDIFDHDGRVVGHSKGEPSFAAGVAIVAAGGLLLGALAIMLPPFGVWTPLTRWIGL